MKNVCKVQQIPFSSFIGDRLNFGVYVGTDSMITTYLLLGVYISASVNHCKNFPKNIKKYEILNDSM